MTNIEFVDDSVVPGRRRTPNAIDSVMSDALRQNPGRWAKYPLEAQYHALNLASDEGFAKAINWVRSKVHDRSRGAYRAAEGERFNCRIDRPARVIYVRYTKES